MQAVSVLYITSVTDLAISVKHVCCALNSDARSRVEYTMTCNAGHLVRIENVQDFRIYLRIACTNHIYTEYTNQAGISVDIVKLNQ